MLGASLGARYPSPEAAEAAITHPAGEASKQGGTLATGRGSKCFYNFLRPSQWPYVKMKSERSPWQAPRTRLSLRGLLPGPQFSFQCEADLASLAPTVSPVFWIVKNNHHPRGTGPGPRAPSCVMTSCCFLGSPPSPHPTSAFPPRAGRGQGLRRRATCRRHWAPSPGVKSRGSEKPAPPPRSLVTLWEERGRCGWSAQP